MNRCSAFLLLAALLPFRFSSSAQSTSAPDPLSSRLQAIRLSAIGIDAMPVIEQLTERIGPRLTGTPAANKAAHYALAHMRELGLANVHAEPWTLTRGWARGSAQVELLSPFHLPIPVAAYGWTGSTPSHQVAVPLILLKTDEVEAHLDDLVRSQGATWRGTVLLLSSSADKPMHAYAQLLPFLRAATRAHAIAVLRHDTRPGAGMVHSEPVALELPQQFGPDLIPALDLPAEHEALLERLLTAAQPVSLSIQVQNHFTRRPVTSENLVGEIPGALYPEQIILVAAHLDSWDLGTGATDDGFGVAAVLAAAQAILHSGLRPARTLRFVLFTGEEQGLLGSRAYVREHAAEWNSIEAVFALDWGAGPITRLPTAGHPELLPLLTRLNQLAPELNLEPPDQ